MNRSVDVIIPALNEGKRIANCLEALRKQTYPLTSFKVYVIDNGSSDGTLEIAKSFGVTALFEKKRGASAARNAGLRHSTGELVAFIDADCEPSPHWIEKMVATFTEPRIAGVQGKTLAKSKNQGVQKFIDSTQILSDDRLHEISLGGTRNLYPWMITGNCMYRRVALLQVGGFNESFTYAEDMDLGWRIFLLGYSLKRCVEAELTDWYPEAPLTFARQWYGYGKGLAFLSEVYRAHGVKSKIRFDPKLRYSGWIGFLLHLYFQGGYWKQRVTNKFFSLLRNSKTLTPYEFNGTLETSTPPFLWEEGKYIKFSNHLVTWNEGETARVVFPKERERLVLNESGKLILDLLLQQKSKTEVKKALLEAFDLELLQCEEDVEVFINQLFAARVIENALKTS